MLLRLDGDRAELLARLDRREPAGDNLDEADAVVARTAALEGAR